jgi:hypothetical protein
MTAVAAVLGYRTVSTTGWNTVRDGGRIPGGRGMRAKETR